jgi:hypothetical protein
MDKKVLIIDTSILCVFLKVPGKKTCGPDSDRWEFKRVNDEIETEKTLGSNFVLPKATIIETGNHIPQATGKRFDIATQFCDLILEAAKGNNPWLPLGKQGETLWNIEQLIKLTKIWPKQAESGHSMGDATIVDIANYYDAQGVVVAIFTEDQGLKAYQPSTKDDESYLRR